MHTTTAKLLQIQNMELTIDENAIIHKRKQDNHIYTDLKAKIDDLKRELPGNLMDHFEHISKRYDVSVIPMLNNTCTGCFMKLSVGEANQAKSDKAPYLCPNCSRFLYFEEQSNLMVQLSDCKGIARFSAPELIFADIQADDKFDALQQIATAIGDAGYVLQKDEFVDGLLQREKLLSTAVGNGIAFPHARGNYAAGLTFAIGRIKDGIDFGEGEKVYLLFTFSIPTNVNRFYIEVISKLAKYFNRSGSLERMLKCKDAEAMWKVISRLGN